MMMRCYSFMNIKVLPLDFHPSNIWIREMTISCLEATQLNRQVDITQLLSILSALTLFTLLYAYSFKKLAGFDRVSMCANSSTLDLNMI